MKKIIFYLFALIVLVFIPSTIVARDLNNLVKIFKEDEIKFSNFTIPTDLSGVNMDTLVYDKGPYYLLKLPSKWGETKYAVRYTPTLSGAISSVQFYVVNKVNNSGTGKVRFTAHQNIAGSVGGIPGAQIGSSYVDVPFSSLSDNAINNVDLSTLKVSVTYGTDFHIVAEVFGGATDTLKMAMDDGTTAPTNRSSSYFSGYGWYNFIDANNFGRGYNIIMRTVIKNTAGWSSQSSGTTEWLTKVFFLNENTGYAVGTNGTILKTTNGGTNWNKLNSGITKSLRGVFFLNVSVGYVVGDDGTILKTTNGGTSWNSQQSGTNYYLKDVVFLNEKDGYIVGGDKPFADESATLKTTNGGITWDVQEGWHYVNLYDTFFLDINTGHAVGYGCENLKTTDGGITWNEYNAYAIPCVLTGVFFLNVNTGYAVGWEYSGEIIKTTDGGTSWVTQIEAGNGASIFFLNVNTGYTAGFGGKILNTTNGGTNWNSQISGTTEDLHSNFFVNSNVGYAVGENGTILKYTDTLPIPNGPSNLTATITTGNRKIQLNWTDNANNETGYTVYRFNTPIANLSANTTNYIDSVPTDGIYNYKVRAINNSGVSTFSNWAEVVVSETPTVTVVSPNGGELWGVGSTQKIVWNATDNVRVSAISIYYQINSWENWTRIDSITTSLTNPDTINWSIPSVQTSKANIKICVYDEFGNKAEDVSDGNFTITYWTNQTSGTTNSLRGTFFINESTGYTVGLYGTIRKTTNKGASWSNQTSGTTNTLWSIFFLDESTGYIAGSSGTILKTTNGGTSWRSQASGNTNALLSVYFLDANTGYTAGENGTILKTTNGGTNWSSLSTGTTNNLYCIYFIDQNIGYVAGANGTILKTTNGTSWNKQTSGTTNALRSIFFLDSNVGYSVGDLGTILKTADEGFSWNKLTSGTSNYLYSVHFLDSNVGYVIGVNGTVLKTTNGGTNWSNQISTTTNTLWNNFFTDTNNGYVVGDNGTILKYTDILPIPNTPTNLTANVGKEFDVSLHWIDNANNETEYTVYRFNMPIANLPIDTTDYIDYVPIRGNYTYKVRAINPYGVSAFSNVAYVFVDTTTGVENKIQASKLTPKVFALSQNYPNPFNPETNINFAIPKDEQTTLRIYDISGRLVKTLINEHKTAGYYSVKWNGQNEKGEIVPSGLYLYQITSGNYSSTKRMLLLK